MWYTGGMNKKSGFTLVELLIVIVIIAILAGIGIASYNGMQRRAADSKIQANLSQVRTYLASYRALNQGKYPEPQATTPPSSTQTVKADDLKSFLNDPDMPFTPYIVSPNRKKFCILVSSKRYTDIKYTLGDTLGDGNILTNSGSSATCPGSLSD